MHTADTIHTCYDVYLPARTIAKHCKEACKHFLGEKIRFELHAYPSQKEIDGRCPAIYKNLPLMDPFYKDKNNLLSILTKIHVENPKAKFQVFGIRYVDDPEDK